MCECVFNLDTFNEEMSEEEQEKFVRYGYAYSFIWSMCSSATPSERQKEKIDG